MHDHDGVSGVFVGLATLDVMHRVEAPPGPNQKVTALSQSISAGGPATGAALTFAALGGRATLVTALGSGAVADLVRRDLGALGVAVLDATPEAEGDPPVSVVAVTAATGERSIVSVDAVTARTPVPDGLDDLVRAADVVLADGHHPALAGAAARAAREAGVDLVVDAGRWKPAMREIAPLATHLVCSADFRVPPGEPVPEPAVRVVTHGGDPVEWWAGGDSGTVAVPAVTVHDTLGAGDAFHGAYAFYAGFETPARIALATGVATRRCESDGPRAWLAELARWRA